MQAEFIIMTGKAENAVQGTMDINDAVKKAQVAADQYKAKGMEVSDWFTFGYNTHCFVSQNGKVGACIIVGVTSDSEENQNAAFKQRMERIPALAKMVRKAYDEDGLYADIFES